MAKSKFKTIWKVFKRSITALLLLLVLILVLLRIPAVQTFITGKVTNYIASKTDSAVQIDKVAINFVDLVCIKGIYVEDDIQDTLLYADQLTVDIAFFKLFTNTIQIDKINLQAPRINIHQRDEDRFNFSFLIEAFASEEKDSSTDESSLIFDINSVEISEPRIDVNLLDNKMKVYADNLYLNLETFDLEKLNFEFNEITAKSLYAEMESAKVVEELPINNIENKSKQELIFPLKDLPISLAISRLNMEDSEVFIHDKGASPSAHFNASYINVSNIDWKAKDISINDKIASVNFTKLEANINDKIKINQLELPIRFSEKQLQVDGFEIRTNNSNASAIIKLDYNSYSDLINLEDQLNIIADITDIKLLLSELEYFVPSLGNVDGFTSIKNKSLYVKSNLTGNTPELKLNSMLAKIGKSKIDVKGQIANITDVDRLQLSNFSANGKVHYEDYFPFIESKTLRNQLRELGIISLNTRLNGNLEQVNFDELQVNTEAILLAELSGNVSSLDDQENLSFNLNIEEIRSGKADMQIFLDSLPTVLNDFDTINYAGNLKGDLHAFDLQGAFETSLGDIQTGLDISFNDEYDNATYNGLLELEEFNLGKMIQNDSLGKISMSFDIQGSGLEVKNLNTSIDGIIEKIDYNGYKYENINIDGKIEAEKFGGLVELNDENANLTFNGFIDMNDEIPVMDFELLVDTLDLFALNLYEEPLGFHFAMKSEIRGFTLDEIIGNIVVDSLHLGSEDKFWSTDSINFTAKDSMGSRGLFLDADFLDASITGDYTLAELPETVLDFLDQYFPMQSFLGSTPGEDNILNATEKRKIRGDKINVAASWYDMEKLLAFFSIPVERMDSSYFKFNLNAPDNLTDMELSIPYLIYDGYKVENIFAQGKNTLNEKLDVFFQIDSVTINPETSIANIESKFLFTEDKAIMDFLIQSSPNERSIASKITARSIGLNNFVVDIDEDFYLNDKKWIITQDSSIAVRGGDYSIPSVNLNHREENISFSGNKSKLVFDFEKFKLSNITELVSMDSLQITGLLNGDVNLGLVEEEPITGDLLIENVYFNDLEIGNFDLLAAVEGSRIESLVNVEGKSVQLNSKVDYELNGNSISGFVDLTKFDLRAVDPFISTYAKEVSGMINGKMDVSGTVDKPDIDGVLNISDAKAYIVAIETNYKIKDGVLNLKEDKIKPVIVLEDEENRLANLSGEITHDYFQDLQLALDFDADAFTFLDSEKSRKSDFYGKFVGSVAADIRGPLEKPVVNARIKALNGTDVTLQLLTAEKSITNENYIIFYDGNELNEEQAIDSLASVRYQTDQNIEMNLDIQTDTAALFHVVVDQLTGDKLDVRGTSNLFVKIPPIGDMNIIGDFTVTKGQYRLSYENTIKRNFEINEGSKIQFLGSPLSAILDMQAIYETRTNTYALVNTVGSSLEDGSASNREVVQVVLNVGGTLSKPELSFDIQLPENSSGPINNSVSQALSNLRQNETQLLEQVFSLILFNGFTGGSSGGNLSSVGTATAVSSLGNLMNSQLNKLSKNDKGFSLNVDVDQYQNVQSDNGSITKLGLGVQQKLFDDKLEISVGGNANLETSNESDNQFSSFAGDFVIRYYLTDERNFLVKVFQKSDYDALSNDSVWKTGLGLTYKKTLGNRRRKK